MLQHQKPPHNDCSVNNRGTPFYNRPVRVADFTFHLPEERIARYPLADRAASRLLHLTRSPNTCEDCQFTDLPRLLRSGDVLVRNNTRVFPARLLGHREGATVAAGQVEVLLTRQLTASALEWQCLVRPGKKVRVGERLLFQYRQATNVAQNRESDPDFEPGMRHQSSKWDLSATVLDRGEFGERRIAFDPLGDGNNSDGDIFQRIEGIGHIPLPPYLGRPDDVSDRERYQTVYASQRGSVAAPTAGLHFTPQVLSQLQQRGVESAEITLHVGLGTFQPVRVERVEDHTLHAECYAISPESAVCINRALDEGRRVVAVGTTSVRTLEHIVRQPGNAGRVIPGSGETSLFIYPGFQFQAVGAILTNFHLPESTLLMLVCAFAGRERVLSAYEHAVAAQYRFYSYGDCMLVE